MGQFICFDAKFIYVHLKERNRDYSVYKYMLYLFYLFSQRKEEKKIKFVKSLILKLRYKMNYGSDCKRSLGFCKKQNSKRLTMLSTFPLKVFSFFFFFTRGIYSFHSEGNSQRKEKHFKKAKRNPNNRNNMGICVLCFLVCMASCSAKCFVLRLCTSSRLHHPRGETRWWQCEVSFLSRYTENGQGW